MPTNVPPQAKAIYEEYLQAEKTAEKIAKLEEYLSVIPKHKGTENLIKRVKRKIAKLKVKKEKAKKKGAKTVHLFTVPKKLDVQLPLFGTPQVGKSSVFKMLTGAKPQVGSRTRFPHQGAFYFKGVGCQVIDLPPLFSPSLRETPHGTELMGIARNADLIFLVIDLSQSISWQYKTVNGAFAEAGIELKAKESPITFKEVKKGGIRLYGMDYVPIDKGELKQIIRSAGVSNCIFEAHRAVSREQVINVISRDISRKQAIIVATKADLLGSEAGLTKLKDVTDLPLVVTSAYLERGRQKLGDKVIEVLNLMRVWTKPEKSKRAIVLKRGATVRDAAEKIHSSFASNLKFARITRKGVKVEKKRVGEDFTLHDGDHIKFVMK